MTQPDAALMRGQWSEAELTERGWTLPDIAELRYLREQEQELPDTAPKALLSIRLSVLSEETTSPVRQELDLYRFCIERGSRAVGVARDLGVSATKSAPWERPELGDWINNRSPEFDEILFWKLDRFVRRISDLHLMIEWCTCYSKTLASKMDPVDLTTESGRHLGIILAGMARIEGANTGVRVESLWTYSRTASRWVIGKPVYGYTTVKRDGGRFLEIDPTKHRTLRWIYSMLQRNYSLYRICKILNRTDFLPPNKGKWSSGNLKVILINPTLMGYRVYRPKDHKQGNPPLVSQTADGRPIRIAEPIFSEEEYKNIQDLLQKRQSNSARIYKNRTPFLGIIKCGLCGSNWYEQTKVWKVKDGSRRRSRRLRCASFVGGSACGAPSLQDPQNFYEFARDTVLRELGDYEVVHRTYARGGRNLSRKNELEARIEHYLKELEPGGAFKVGGFIEARANETLQNLGRELSTIDPQTTHDRWIYSSAGVTYRSHWERNGKEQMEHDLRRGGITLVIHQGNVELAVPADVKDKLITRQNFFQQ